MNHSSAVGQQALPPPTSQHQHHNIPQHPRSSGYLQHHRSRSPHQPPHTSMHSIPQQGAYASPHSSTHSLPPHSQSPYLPSSSGLPSQHSAEPGFFAPHPSPYSTSSANASYASSETNETMVAQAALHRHSYPGPIASYQTPQSNSPTSIHSPHTDGHGRPMYNNMSSMHQSMYYPPQYQVQQQPPPYPHHPPSVGSNSGILLSHPQSQPHPLPQQHSQTQHAAVPPHSQAPGILDSKNSTNSAQRVPSIVDSSQGSAQTPSGPGMHHAWPLGEVVTDDPVAPGPIPATTPLVVRQDNNGVQWIAFEYSRDRIKLEYTIRCDVESVDVDALPQDFKTSNCVYPRACVGKDQYKGNRHHYETECNTVGWALAQLNPSLRDKRGLIQRAVDSWRNSNQDPRLRSRRVRRMAKLNNRKAAQMQPATSIANHHGPPHSSVQAPQGMQPGMRTPAHLGPAAHSMQPHQNGGSGGAEVALFHHM